MEGYRIQYACFLPTDPKPFLPHHHVSSTCYAFPYVTLPRLIPRHLQISPDRKRFRNIVDFGQMKNREINLNFDLLAIIFRRRNSKFGIISANETMDRIPI